MRNLLFLSLIIVFPFFMLSCEKGEDNSEWKATNEAAYNEITTNPAYHAVTTPGGPAVYCKVLNSGVGTEKPIQTAKVKVFYQGKYYDGTVFDNGTSLTNVPSTFQFDQVVRGFGIALQNMVIGDKWEIWVPWELGYGANGLVIKGVQKIPGYSTLMFTVELLEITQYP